MPHPRLVVAAALGATLTATVASVVAAVPATAARPSEVVHGKKTYPTVESAHAQHASGAASGSGRLSYQGGVDGVGVTTGAPKVYLVFWGSQWGPATGSSGPGTSQNVTFTGDPQHMAPRLQQLFKGIGTNSEQWSGVMTQYCEGVGAGSTSCPSSSSHVGYPAGGALATGAPDGGVWVDTLTAAPSQASGEEIAAEAVAAAAHFGNGAAGANRNAQYVIVSPHGTHPDGFNTPSANWCAWHDYNGDSTLTGGAAPSSFGDVSFTNLPYLTDMGASCGQGYVNTGSAGTLDGVTIVAGHEYAETITDQNPAGGWIDNAGYENADKCAWNGVGGTGGAVNVAFATGSFAMQATYSNDVTACRNAHAIVTNGGSTANTVAVNNPGSQSTAVGAQASLQMTGTDTGSGQTLTYTATGLPAGLAISTSGLISGAATTAGTSTVTVTAKDGTGATGSTSFTWTVTSTSSTCTAKQLLGNPGFETGAAAPWTSTAGVVSNSSAEPAHSGSWDAWLDGYGTTHTDTVSQSVSIPAGCTNSTLSFWLHINTSETTTSTAYDKLTVTVGSTTLATYSNLNKNSGYAQKSFNVGSYAGQTVTVKFTGTEDSSLQTSFVVDDTALNVA